MDQQTPKISSTVNQTTEKAQDDKKLS